MIFLKNIWCAIFHRRYIYPEIEIDGWRQMHCNICNESWTESKTEAQR